MIDTKISWEHATWNPWTGCKRMKWRAGQSIELRGLRISVEIAWNSRNQMRRNPHETRLLISVALSRHTN